MFLHRQEKKLNNKNMKAKPVILIAAVIVILIAAAGIWLWLTNLSKEIQSPEIIAPGEKKVSLSVSEELLPIELSEEEKAALQEEGIEPPSSKKDNQTNALQEVRPSDQLLAIEADINSTDISGIDREISDIDKDLLGL